MKIYKLMSAFMVILACLMALKQAAPVVAQGNAVYVSTSGSDDTGNGSIGNPFRTIGHALTIAVAGDEIVLRGAPALSNNRYAESVRIQQPNITIRSQTSEWAIIECPVNDENVDICVRFDVDSDGGKLQRLEVVGGYYYGIKFETRWDWGDPNNRSGASNILIEDVKVHDTGNAAIKITPGCDDITIRRAELYNTGRIRPDSAEGIDNVNGDRMTVQDSYIHDTTETGLYFKGGAMDCVVERNRIERTGGAGVLVGFDTSPEFFDLTVNPDYYESIRGVVRNNIISDTQWSGIGLYAAQDAQIWNNTLIDTAQTYHNPIYFGLTYQDWESYAGRPPSVNPVIRNNLVYQSSGLPTECVFIRYSDDLGGLSALEGMPDMEYNLYFRANGSCLFTDRRPGSYLDGGTFSQWQTHIGGDTHSLTTNPQLAADGSLPAGSPAIDSGSNSTCPATDKRGVSRPQDGDGNGSQICDMGAIEYKPVVIANFKSTGTYDGWILESTETSNKGGTLDKTATTFNLGDGAADKQYRAILSFNTINLPDNAVITKVTLKIRKQGLVGTDPFTILGGLKVDMRKPFFGTALNLVIGDFQAAAGKSAVATFGKTPVSNWYSALLNATGRAYVNKTGTTQFRLRFVKDDNNDNAADYMKFFSGNHTTASIRPTLVIEYYVP